MSAVDWEEVKRLAADFQRAQLSSGAQRLSERNCIEIINRLVEEKLIDVVYTTDGKEYITPQHLSKEIKDELFVSGGRINLVDLAKNLSVDIQIVSKKATEIEKSDASVRIVNGEMISNTYILQLATEINEKLQEQGQVSVADLTGQYDLPADFLLSVIEKQIGKLIHGIQDKQDCQIIFTQTFVERNLSIVRGALLAITKPISTSTLVSLCAVQERLFFSAVDSLIERKEMPGVLTGKQKMTGNYVPYIYTKSQLEWVNNFYQQNGFLEFQGMARLGISDATGFIQKNFSKANLMMLSSVAVGQTFLDQVEAAVDEAVSTASFVKILQVLPTAFEPSDVDVLLQKVLLKKGASQNLHVYNSTVVVTDQYLRTLIKNMDSLVEESAAKFVKSGDFMKMYVEKNQKGAVEEKVDFKADKKEERRKKASEGKSGGGAQGRETKTKSTKKKYMKGKQQQQELSDEEPERSSKGGGKVCIVKRDEITNAFTDIELLQDEDDDLLLEELVEYLYPLLNKKSLELAQVMFESTIASVNQNRKKKHSELQEKLSTLLLNVRLFEKGIRQFDNIDSAQQIQLTKYLLKTVCTDIVNEIFLYIAHEHSKLYEDLTDLTIEQRINVINEAPPDMRETLLKVHKSLAGSSLEDFLTAAEVALGPGASDIMVVRHDKKKERPHMLHLRQQLIEQLNIADDPALVLHLATLIVFQANTQTMLHASGKFVSFVLTFLQTHVDPDVFDTLRTYHDLVLQYLSNSEEKAKLASILDDQAPRIKEIALAAKKTAAKNKERTTSD